MLDPRIEVLQAVEKYGTVTAAAEALSYSPSTISYQIRQLAQIVGSPLIEQSGRNSKLTPAARIILRHATIMQAQWETARSELAATENEPSGTFVLCGFSTASTQILPNTASVLSKRYPRLETRLVQADPLQCFELLEMGKADIALVMVTPGSPALNDSRFEQQLLVDDPLDLVVPKNHPLTEKKCVTLADAAEESWIISRPDSAYHNLTVGACVAAGFSPNLVHQADEWETGAAMVSQNLGVTLVPRLGVLSPYWDVTRIPLSGEPIPARRIIAATRKGASSHPLISETLELVRVRSTELYDYRTSKANTPTSIKENPD